MAGGDSPFIQMWHRPVPNIEDEHEVEKQGLHGIPTALVCILVD